MYSPTSWISHLHLAQNWILHPTFGPKLNWQLLVSVQGHICRKCISHLSSWPSSWDGEKVISNYFKKAMPHLLSAFNKRASLMGLEWLIGCFLPGTSKNNISLYLLYKLWQPKQGLRFTMGTTKCKFSTIGCFLGFLHYPGSWLALYLV